MPAYLIVRVTIDRPEAYQEYMRHTPRVINRHGGRMIVRGGEVETLEGPEEKHRIVIIEFPSKEAAQAFYHSEDYQKAKHIREGAGQGQFVIVDGYPQDTWQAAVAQSDALTFGA